MPAQPNAEEHRMPIEDKSHRLVRGPEGFLQIHWLGGTPVEMRYVAQGLAHAGYTVHVPQLAGHCGTVEELNATTWQHWYESVEEEIASIAARSSSAAFRWVQSWHSITLSSIPTMSWPSLSMHLLSG